MPDSSADRLSRYKLIRDEIAHEDNLIGSRLSWFTASQSFLLTALAIVQGARPGWPRAETDYLFPLAPLVGIISSALILLGVMAGLGALKRWRQILDQNPAEYAEFPRVAKDGWIIGLGWSAPIGLPVVFLLMWAVLLIAGL